MTKEDIIRMAREAGFSEWAVGLSEMPSHLEHFAALVTSAERKPLSDEEIYSLADSLEIWNEDDEEWILDPNTFARAIEAAHDIKETEK